MKSKVLAYVLWFFLGVFGAHKFYVGKIGAGIIYFFTFGLFGFGVLIDLFTLGHQVDVANALLVQRGGNTYQTQQSVVVNITNPPIEQPSDTTLEKNT